MATEQCETVKVKSGDSYAIINASDFVEGTHTLYEDHDTKEKAKPKK